MKYREPSILRDFWQEGWVGKAILIGVPLLIALGIWAAFHDAKQWEKFAREHECRVVGKVSGTASVGFDSNANIITTHHPGKTGYACSDGVTYWR